MFEVTQYESRRRIRGAVALAVFVGVFALLIVGIFPSVEASGVDFEAYVENLPTAVSEGFNVQAINTIQGFLAAELYQFVWLLLLGLYMAYAGGGTVAGDVETGRLDLLLATPVSRRRLVLEKFLSLSVPIVLVNLFGLLFVYGGAVLVDESIAIADLAAVHLLSIPYLYVCASVGLLLSVVLSRADVAQRGGIAAVFALFLLDTVSLGTDYEWLGKLSPTRYFDPTDILVEGTYDVGGALVLSAATVLLVLASLLRFQQRDV
jgi:ABC-2 type transport system permease protein